MEIWAEWPDKFAGLKIKRERVKRPGYAGFEVRERGRGVFWDFFCFLTTQQQAKIHAKA
jgi:hypothetical protein